MEYNNGNIRNDGNPSTRMLSVMLLACYTLAFNSYSINTHSLLNGIHGTTSPRTIQLLTKCLLKATWLREVPASWGFDLIGYSIACFCSNSCSANLGATHPVYNVAYLRWKHIWVSVIRKKILSTVHVHDPPMAL